MSEANKSDTSTSDSEVNACGSGYNPLKALYSEKVKIPVESAPLYENIAQFEAAQERKDEIIPVGEAELVAKREKEKQKKIAEEEKLLAEKNKQRFAKYEVMVPTEKKEKANVLTRMEGLQGPLRLLKECVDLRLRVKITTRNAVGIRGMLYGFVVAFDKHWNLALSDVLEIWTRKRIRKLKTPSALGVMVPKGTAAKISPIPVVTETPLGGGMYKCQRHIPQMMVRGEHIVLINLPER